MPEENQDDQRRTLTQNEAQFLASRQKVQRFHEEGHEEHGEGALFFYRDGDMNVATKYLTYEEVDENLKGEDLKSDVFEDMVVPAIRDKNRMVYIYPSEMGLRVGFQSI